MQLPVDAAARIGDFAALTGRTIDGTEDANRDHDGGHRLHHRAGGFRRPAVARRAGAIGTGRIAIRRIAIRRIAVGRTAISGDRFLGATPLDGPHDAAVAHAPAGPSASEPRASEPRRRLSALRSGAECRARLHRDLRAGIPPQRHGHHPAHALPLATRLTSPAVFRILNPDRCPERIARRRVLQPIGDFCAHESRRRRRHVAAATTDVARHSFRIHIGKPSLAACFGSIGMRCAKASRIHHPV